MADSATQNAKPKFPKKRPPHPRGAERDPDLRGVVVDGIAEVEIERPVGPYEHVTRRLLHDRRCRHLAPISLSLNPQLRIGLPPTVLLPFSTLQNPINLTDHQHNPEPSPPSGHHPRSPSLTCRDMQQ
jgi:hypothetical protein